MRSQPEVVPTGTNVLTSIEMLRVCDMDVRCRVDTGARRCSLDVWAMRDTGGGMVQFAAGSQLFRLRKVAVARIQNAHGTTERPVVLLDYQWKDQVFKNVETTLADRAGLRYPGLVGRNLIRLIGPVHIAANDN